MNKIILIDSNSLINKAFYAMPPLMNKKGEPTGAVYGFLSMLIKLIDELEPTHIVAAFDLKAPTFRHKIYADYKAGRRPMPEELVKQIPMLKEMLKAMDIKICELSGYEADDILGTLSVRFDDLTYVVSGDKDTLQLVSENTEVWLAKKGITEVDKYTLKKMSEAGFLPYQVVEFKALSGDSSDNIKGVKGVGEKTARDLLTKYENLENIYEHIDELKGKLKEKLIDGRDSAFFSRQLATINVNTPIECSLSDCKFIYPFGEKQLEKFNEYEFTSLVSRLKFEVGVKQEKETKKVNTVQIRDIDEFKEILSGQNGVTAIAFGKNIRIAFDGDTTYEIVIEQNLFGEGLAYDDAIKLLKPILTDKNIKILAYDVKAINHSLKEYGIEVDNYFDLLLAGYIIKSKNLRTIEDLFSDFNMIYDDNVCLMFDLYEIESECLKEQNLLSLYENVELPLQKVLFDMEQEGVSIDVIKMKELGDEFTAELKGLTNEIYALAGKNFNINSPKQLGEILFVKLGLKNGKKTKTGYSTGEEVLNRLLGEHPIIELLLRYRKIAKLNSTYIEGLKGLVNEGKIHTTYQQTVTTTGRLSSTNPNLQNIPTRDSEGSRIREIFVASKGNTLVSADYSQIELRLLAHFADDEKLIDAYLHADDIHSKTASEIFGVDIAHVTKQMRRNAKAVNFGIIYGISGFGLANNLEISRYKAQEYIDRYFATYPKVKQYMESNVAFAKRNGYVLTLFNRRRYIPEINSSNYQVRTFGERAAMNMPLQGTAADLIKVAMINVYNRLNKEKMKAKLILQIHDELILDCPKEETEKAKKIIIEEMEGAAKLRVPLIADAGVGENWLKCK